MQRREERKGGIEEGMKKLINKNEEKEFIS